jgi:DnaJ family protein C protein 17
MSSSTDDLKQYATSSHDFYELLGVTFENSESDIKRAYRKAVLKYHPDKNHADPRATVEKFHLVQTAYEVLTDPAVKAAYDNARTARLAKQRQKDLFDGKRRQMADDLERRERGVKRTNDGDLDAEERLAREIRRLGEDGKRRRTQRDEDLRRMRQEEEMEEQERSRREMAGLDDPVVPASTSTKPHLDAAHGDTDGRKVPEIERTVRIRWAREAERSMEGDAIDRAGLEHLFSRFGAIETMIPIKEKRVRVGQSKEKKLMAYACAVFESLASAQAAVAESSSQPGIVWTHFESIVMLADQHRHTSPLGETNHGNLSSAASTPASSPKTQGYQRNHPVQTPNNASPLARLSTPSSTASPSFEDTMRRLKAAEKARLAAEEQRQRHATETSEG